MSEEKDPELERLKDVAAMTAVHFSDFLIIVRTKDGMAWKHSDPTWGCGAAMRYPSSYDAAIMQRQQDAEDPT